MKQNFAVKNAAMRGSASWTTSALIEQLYASGGQLVRQEARSNRARNSTADYRDAKRRRACRYSHAMASKRRARRLLLQAAALAANATCSGVGVELVTRRRRLMAESREIKKVEKQHMSDPLHKGVKMVP